MHLERLCGLRTRLGRLVDFTEEACSKLEIRLWHCSCEARRVFKEGASFPVVPIRRRGEPLPNPGQRVIRVEGLCLEERLIGQFDVLMLEIEHA